MDILQSKIGDGNLAALVVRIEEENEDNDRSVWLLLHFEGVEMGHVGEAAKGNFLVDGVSMHYLCCGVKLQGWC